MARHIRAARGATLVPMRLNYVVMRHAQSMVEALVRMRFVVPQIWIGFDALGVGFDLQWDQRRVRVTLPEGPESFSALPEAYASAFLPSLSGVGPLFAEEGRDLRTAAMVVFEVTVDLDTAFPAPKPQELTDELREIAEGDLRAGMAIVEEAAELFVRHVRAAAPSQTWLGLASHKLTQYGIAQLEYRDTGERIFGLGPVQTVTMRSSRLRLDAAHFAEVAVELEARREPAITDSLLTDAWHLSDAAVANDQDRATLVAATACEVRVKQEIQLRVPADRRAMADLILRRRSNLPELVDEVLLATLGVSLRKADPDLYRKVQALAKQRNAIVHGGRRDPLVKEAHAPAQIASNLFEWLAGIAADSHDA